MGTFGKTCNTMRIWAGTVTIVRKDNINRTVTVHNVVISGGTLDEIKHNPTNLKRAIFYSKLPKAEQQEDRWRIKDAILHTELGVPGPPRFHNGLSGVGDTGGDDKVPE